MPVPSTAAPTLHQLVTQAAQRLTDAGVSFGHGTTNALDEAAWLVLWRLGLALDTDVSDSAEASVALSSEQVSAVQALIEERINSRKPAAYLTKQAWLQGLAFYVDERAIVPRSLIAELLVGGDLDYWLPENTHKVLDMCTGNGSLAVLAAIVFPDVVVDAADISTDALAVAQINVAQHGVPERVRLLQSDGWASLAGDYDLVLCNPPYVNTHSMAALPAEYRAEPQLALAGGTDGMDFIRTLLQHAPMYMQANAVLVLEVGNERDHFEAAFPTLEVVWLETSAGADQVLLVTREALKSYADNARA